MIVWHTTAGTFVGEDQRAILAQFRPGAWYEPDHHLRPVAVGRIVTDHRWITLALVLVENGPAPTATQVAQALDGAEPLIHPNLRVEATHYTGPLENPRLACEVHPGVIVADDGGGVYSVLTVAHIFAALPPEHAGATFVIAPQTAWFAADMYDSSMVYAKQDLWYASTRSDDIPAWEWPPRGWESLSTYTASRSGHPIGRPRE